MICLNADVVGGQILFWFVPVHAFVAGLVGAYTAYYLIDDHSGVKLTPIWPWQPTSQYHDDHHRFFHVNFGQHILFWDRMMGTIRSVDKRYGEDCFGGKGKGAAARGRQGAGGGRALRE